MKKKWSKSWNKSKQPRKQRKYRYNAPLHVRDKFMHATLSKELRKKYGVRSIRVRKGDKVIVMRGQLKGHSGKVERVDTKKHRIYVSKAEISKKDGSKAQIPINCSNVMIQELVEERKRFKRTQAKSQQPKKEEKKEEKSEKQGQKSDASGKEDVKAAKKDKKKANVVKNDKKTP
ncbi:50S ribosomal protein L24 [Candidatus Woesearchaeota archaeon]|nr:MAG: 50S ribosomal protein L24 [Candidatus Woesearchaeota archaeon]